MVFLALHSGMLAGFTGRVSSSVSLGSCFSGLMCKGRTCEWPFLVSFDVPWYGIPCTYFNHRPFTAHGPEVYCMYQSGCI